MASIPTQVRIDSENKQQASELFNSLGLDMSGAINIVLHQCVLRGGLPFPVELPGTAAARPAGAARLRFGIARNAFHLPTDYLERSEELDKEIARELYGGEK